MNSEPESKLKTRIMSVSRVVPEELEEHCQCSSPDMNCPEQLTCLSIISSARVVFISQLQSSRTWFLKNPELISCPPKQNLNSRWAPSFK